MGTTPPSENVSDHPAALQSQCSYPGTTQITQIITNTNSSNTVPPSPTTIQV